MERPRLGKTTYEQLAPELTPSKRSPWAILIVIVVVILFGIFWYVERPEMLSFSTPQNTAQRTTEVAPETTAPATEPAQPDEIGELTAAAINTAIPNFTSRL